MPSDLTSRDRAVRALYGPHCILADVEPGAMTEAVESAIVAAVADERERCATIADDQSDLGKAIGRLRTMRAGLIREIAMRERELAALRAKLAGVDMVFAECGGRGDG
jgi:hypothetical protein